MLTCSIKLEHIYEGERSNYLRADVATRINTLTQPVARILKTTTQLPRPMQAGETFTKGEIRVIFENRQLSLNEGLLFYPRGRAYALFPTIDKLLHRMNR